MKLKQPSLPHMTNSTDVIEIFIDGAARGNPGESGIGVLIKKTTDDIIEVKKYLGTKTNNQAEYTALITALENCVELADSPIRIYTDSLLVANQINGLWKVKHPEIIPLNKKAKTLFQNYKDITIQHIPREHNSEADRLANLAIDEYSS
ncbi:MAG: ribonuclease HI family protein [Thermodesulfobacteriota bacterium]